LYEDVKLPIAMSCCVNGEELTFSSTFQAGYFRRTHYIRAFPTADSGRIPILGKSRDCIYYIICTFCVIDCQYQDIENLLSWLVIYRFMIENISNVCRYSCTVNSYYIFRSITTLSIYISNSVKNIYTASHSLQFYAHFINSKSGRLGSKYRKHMHRVLVCIIKVSLEFVPQVYISN